MDECSMTVVIQTDSFRTLPAPVIARMTSLTDILIVNLVCILFWAFPLNSKRKGTMEYIGPLAAKFGH
jgi:hypothetical protein